MKSSLVLIILCSCASLGPTASKPNPEEIGGLVSRVMRLVVSRDFEGCNSVSHERLAFYYSGETSFTLADELRRCISVIPRDSFPNRNPYQDGYRGRILTVNRVEVRDSIARISATYSEIRGLYPQFRNYGRGAAVEFRKRAGNWVETDRVEGTT
jgi:hypothetical protein